MKILIQISSDFFLSSKSRVISSSVMMSSPFSLYTSKRHWLAWTSTLYVCGILIIYKSDQWMFNTIKIGGYNWKKENNFDLLFIYF